MKYSILVLGASISISLFIRICCSLEANSDKMEDLFSGRADEVYEKFLKHSLLRDSKEDANSVENANHVFDVWINQVNQFKNDIPLHKQAAVTRKHYRTPVKVISNQQSPFNDELCGNTDPPDLSYWTCKNPNGCTFDPSRTQLPPGCEFDREQKNMECIELITNIPPLPPQLNSLNLTRTQIEKISEGDFRNVTIKNIGLFGNQIEYIHPWAFDDVKDLNQLSIVGNKITYLAHELYVGLDNCTFLDLQHNQISLTIYEECPLLPPERIQMVLPSLLWLDLRGNPLTVIPEQIFAGLSSSPLIALYLENCYIETIHEDAFSFLKNLVILNLSRNPSKLIHPIEKLARVLSPLTSLHSIYLADLGFSDFPVEALAPISNQLRVLDLSNNKFHTLKYDALSHFPNLEELYLDECSIQNIEPYAFLENTKLKTLTLIRNQISQVPPYFPPTLERLNLSNIQLNSYNSAPVSFQNLKNLKYLLLGSIKIDPILKTTFVGLSALRNIHVDNCGVKSIEDGAFQDLINVKLMQLDNNPISEVNPETFLGLENLETLSMQNCDLTFSPVSSSAIVSNQTNLTVVEGSPFKYLINMKDLKLSGNNIVSVSASLFQNLPSLCYIHLSNNPIESWETRLFPDRDATIYDDFDPGQSCFLQLYLQNGNVEFIKDAMLQDFLRLWQIDFSNNIVVCDQGACKFRDLLYSSLTTYKQTWINSENYKCKDLTNGKLVLLSDLTDEICSRSGQYDQQALPSPSSGSKTTIIAVMASISIVATVVLILGYKNRAHLRYFWFTFKFNVIPLSPRKAKLSTVEDEPSPNPIYDFDVFISYHKDDSKFIQDVFLPEIEESDEVGVVEAKNTIYLIENDELSKKSNNNNDTVNVKPNAPRFKVCLHERDFAAGVPITENIVDCVDRSRKTVIFVSRKYMESQWCSYELNLAYHRLVESRRKSFVLVLLEPIHAEQKTKVLSYLMASKTYLQWPGVDGTEEDKTSFWKRLRAFLQS